MYYFPCRVFFAEEALTRATPYLIGYGRKALIVTGKQSAIVSGALGDVTAILKAHNIAWHIFDSVIENPTIDTVLDGATEFAIHDCDFLIGIGGGSPIDAAKAISLTAANKLDKTNMYDTSLFSHSFPVVAIPTTSGTGTEVTPYSVLTDPETQKKAGFGSELAYPTLSIIEPRYTLSMSHAVTLNTGIDALSHLLEGIYSNKRNPLLYPNIFSGIKTIYKNLPIVLNEPGNLIARAEMMRASLYGGMTIANTSTTLQHSIGYPLTSVYGIPHGLANGVVMKGIMELYYPAVEAELKDLFHEMKISQHKFFEWIEALQLSIDIHLTPDFMDTRIPEVLSSRNMSNNPFEISSEDIKKIYLDL
ncbi:MAG: alcohol dehydrogenase [Candidatus Cloacimonetes bacterium HGW-Cloacimonetes-1]|jgi:alcohol dehydrogenase|nr:MAG: alcohol dehydrogenase [Candidatus Cloacimonetes bacterium HGW-Cloacimonetes-1]